MSFIIHHVLVLHPSRPCPASIASFIHHVLHPSCPGPILCCIIPVLHYHVMCPYVSNVLHSLSFLSCIHSGLHPFCPASIPFCVHNALSLSYPASIYEVKHPSCPSTFLSFISPALHPTYLSFSASILSCINLVLCQTCHASVLPCIHPILNASWPMHLLFTLVLAAILSDIHHVMQLSCPESILLYINPVQHSPRHALCLSCIHPVKQKYCSGPILSCSPPFPHYKFKVKHLNFFSSFFLSLFQPIRPDIQLDIKTKRLDYPDIQRIKRLGVLAVLFFIPQSQCHWKPACSVTITYHSLKHKDPVTWCPCTISV